MSSTTQFTVKATLASTSVTRKFSFTHASFPTYDELHDQLLRVFPNGREYYLSRLIFSPVPGTSMLIGMEVHNQEQYDRYIAAYQGVYPGGVLKFTVHDKQPGRQLLRAIASSPSLSDRVERASSLINQARMPDRATLLRRLQARSVAARAAAQAPESVTASPAPSTAPSLPSRPVSLYNPAYIPPLPPVPSVPTPPPVPAPPTVPAPPPPMEFSAIPPPPIIYSAPMHMSPPPPMPIPTPSPPSFSTSRPQSYISSSSSCCSVEDKKQEVKELISTFLRDFGELTSSTFGPSMNEFDTPSRSSVTLETPPAKPPKPWLNIPTQPERLSGSPSRENRSPSSQSPSSAVHAGVRCDACFRTIRGVRHKCMTCTDFDFCDACISKPSVSANHSTGHKFFKIPTPEDRIHRGVICDSCDLTIAGTRHKCLDCTQEGGFDLCTECRENGALERMAHDPFHEFISLSEPGRVVVHNVFTGLGQAASPTAARSAQASAPTPEPPAVPPTSHSRRASEQPVVHNAICDLCDSRIEGLRYKCLACPDFDTCASCFKITREQHPAHGFVRVRDPGDLKLRGMVRARDSVRHMASCNVCAKTIYGVRYKCMHPSCPDYDLCADCEAHPVPQHPAEHPMLKMKTAETVVPTVYRVGGTTLISPSAASTPVVKAAPEIAAAEATPVFVSSEDRAAVADMGNPTTDFAHLLNEEKLVDVEPATAPAAPSPLGNEALLSTPNLAPQSSAPAEYFDLLRRLQENFQPSTSTSASTPTPVADPAEMMTQAFKPVVQWVNSTRELLSTAAATASAAAESRRSTPPATEPAPVSPMPGAMPGEVSPISFAPAPLPDVVAAAADMPTFPYTEEKAETEPRLDAFSSVWPSLPAISPSPWSAISGGTEPFIRPVTPVVETPVAETPVIETPTSVSAVSLPTISVNVEVSKVEEIEPVEEAKPAPVATAQPLRTAFVSELNIPDGQIFPPGAEFVKSWVLRNDGERAWPEETELGFVAGERMGAAKRISVGAVAPGAEVTVSTPEMKAPENAGRYVSYWRLFEGEHAPAFGTSVWVDITVAESIQEDNSGESSLAASSVIMPGPSSAGTGTVARGAPSSSAFSDDDAISVASSMSLIDAPSEVASEDAAVTARESVAEGEFVVLYDTSSSDEE